MKAFKILFLLTLIVVFTPGCGNRNNALRDSLAGYTEYQDCLKLCDLLEAQYTKEYDECRKGCPAPAAHFENCILLDNLPQRRSCFDAESLKAVAVNACCQCAQDYLDNMKK